MLEPGTAWEAAPASKEMYEKVAAGIQKDVGRQIVGEGEELCWIKEVPKEERPAMGVCSIKGRVSVDVHISQGQLVSEHAMMDWFG